MVPLPLPMARIEYFAQSDPSYQSMKINEPQNFNSVEKHNAENTELLR